MYGVIPIYSQGKLKQYQLAGNYDNFEIGLFGSPYQTLPPFYFSANGDVSIQSWQLCFICKSQLKHADTYNEFITTRKYIINLPSESILKASKYTNKTTFSFQQTEQILELSDDYFYEYLITLSDGTIYESEIFQSIGAEGINVEIPSDAVWICPPTVYAPTELTIGETAEINVTMERSDSSTIYDTQNVRVRLIISNGNTFVFVFPLTFGEFSDPVFIDSAPKSYKLKGGETETKTFSFDTAELPLGTIAYEVYSECEIVHGSFDLLQVTQPKLVLTFVEIVEDSTISMNIDGATVVFTAKDIPAVNTQFNSAANFVSQFENYLQTFYLTNDYTITRAGDEVTILSNRLNPLYNFDCAVTNKAKQLSNQFINANPVTGRGTFTQNIEILSNDTILVVAFGAGGGVNRVTLKKNGNIVAQSNCNRYQVYTTDSSNYGYPDLGDFDTTAFSDAIQEADYDMIDSYVGGNHLVHADQYPKFVPPTRYEEMKADTELYDLGLFRDLNGDVLYNLTQYHSGQYIWVKGVNIVDTVVLENCEAADYSGIGVAILQFSGSTNLITFTETKAN